jgi:putative oxidoreductase
MSIFEPGNALWASRVRSILRIVSGLIFLTSGTTKIFNYPPLPAGMPPIELMSQAGIGGLLELVLGFLIAIGLLTRPAGFIASGVMAVAYFQFHAPQGFFPTVNQGTPAVLLCFIFFYLVFAGAGVWSVDEMLARSRRAPVR